MSQSRYQNLWRAHEANSTAAAYPKATKQGSCSNDCTRAAVTAPLCQMHSPAESCNASLCICILIQETKEGLTAVSPLCSHTPAAAGASSPALYCWGERQAGYEHMFDRLLSPATFFVPQVPPAISTGAFQMPSVMCVQAA